MKMFLWVLFFKRYRMKSFSGVILLYGIAMFELCGSFQFFFHAFIRWLKNHLSVDETRHDSLRACFACHVLQVSMLCETLSPVLLSCIAFFKIATVYVFALLVKIMCSNSRDYENHFQWVGDRGFWDQLITILVERE